ncbi:hypothetical protein [Methanocaldococcus jannaschii]|nr:hypothetical protein [Methanocaldococcus jannaschii]
MEGESLFLLVSILSFAVIISFVVGLYIWYFKLGGRKMIED